MNRLRIFLCLIAALPAGCDPASDDDDSAAVAPLEGSAGVRGRVMTYPEEEPIPDMSVVLFDVQARYEIALSDEDGEYEASGLRPGFYRAKAWPVEGQNHIGAYYDDMYFYCTGELLDLRRGGTREGVNFRLPHGGAIRGTVTDAETGEPWENARVDVRGLDYYNSNLDPTVYTAADGTFEVVGLDSAVEDLETLTPVPGNYEFKVTVAGRPVIYYPGVYTSGEAEPVGALRGEVIEGVDLALPLGGRIEGLVVDGEGEPATSGTVQARHDEESWMSVTVGLGDDGGFSLGGLAPGPWSLEVRADGLAGAAPPDPIQVDEDIQVDGIEVVLGPEASLSGSVAGPSGAVAGVSVSASPLEDGVDGSATTGEDGAFRIPGLGPGEYRIHLYTSDDALLSGYLCGATACEESAAADAVEVGEAEEVELGPVALPAASVIEGRVRELGNGRPLGRIYVTATEADGVGSHLAVSDDEGVYRLGGLPPGGYWLQAEPYRYCGGDPGWVTTYSGAGRRPEDALWIQVGAGGVITHDLALPVDQDGDGMGDLWEAFHLLDPSRDDALEDPDLDGIVNIDEYLEDRDPREDLLGTSCSAGPAAGGPSAGVVGLMLALALRRATGRGARRW